MLTISVHQDRFYPAESGCVEQTGEGAGAGATINVPLPAGSGDGAYLTASSGSSCRRCGRSSPT